MLNLLLILALGLSAHSESNSLDKIAYFGDSQTGAPGVPMIGEALTECLSRSMIYGFGNATSSTYLGLGKCKLFGSFQGDRGDLCEVAPKRFRMILGADLSSVDTVVIALGDNPSYLNFERLMSAIIASGKNCLWVMPARKIGKNSNTELARKHMRPVAENVCGRKSIIDPSAAGETYETRASDRVHYTADAGKEIGRKICAALKLHDSRRNGAPATEMGDEAGSR